MNKISLWLIGATLLFAASCQREHKEKEEPVFTITEPLRLDTVIYQSYVCQIQAIQHIELRALERGYLESSLVDEGKLVKKGQLLFKLKPSIYQAEMKGAKAERDFAEIEYQTTKKLADSNIVSSSELAMSRAKFDRAKAQLELADAHLGFTEIRAPFDGMMGRFHVRLGSLLDEGELLSTLSDNSKMWVYFNVPEVEYLTIRMMNADQNLPNVKLQLANNMFFDKLGVIETIEADFNNETGNIAFRATFDNTKDLLRHGETGNVLLPVPLKNAILIPQGATFEVLDKKYVYVMDSKNILHSREIEVQAELPHLYVISRGINPGDKILMEGLRKVKNNQKIKYKVKSMREVLSDLHALFAE